MTDGPKAGSSTAKLTETYGQDLLEHPAGMTTERWTGRLAQRDLLDPHFAMLSMGFLSEVWRRPGLDRRSRYLVQIGQFAVSKSLGHLEDALRGAFTDGVAPREALESVLLTHIYSGDTVLEPALAIFEKVAREERVLEVLRKDQLPIDGHDRDRDRTTEDADWPADLADDARRERLTAAYGWLGVNTGVRYRGRTHLDILEGMDRENPAFTKLWMRFTYQGMYSRWVLDDKTRLLCTVGDCLALGAAAAASARDHMQEALQFGNSPQELLDLVYMSGVFFGFPGMTAGRKTLMAILEEEGRLDELQGTPAARG